MINQLKEIYIDATLNDRSIPRSGTRGLRKDYTLALTVAENGLDDPDQKFYENYTAARSGITPAIATPRSTS